MPAHPQDPSLISFPSTSTCKVDTKNKYKLKLQKIQEENSKLHQTLDRKNEEVVSLNNRIAKLVNSIDSLTLECSTVSTTKIADLSKKNRHLSAELHSVKSKCRDLEQSHHNLEQLLLETEEKLKEKSPTEPSPPPPNELQIMSEKLDKANKKIFEVLNQNKQLKTELLMANKCLQLEVGENVNIQQILSGNSNWRGRAQQIAILNTKLSEFRDKMETCSVDSFEEISRAPVKRLESMRRLEVENLTKELEENKNQLEEVKQKIIALKTRNKNLTDDANNYKLKTLDLLEKSERDEEFIKCLNEQVAMLKYECDHKTEEMSLEIERADNLKKEVEIENEKLQCQLSKRQEILNEKENEILNLKRAIQELEQNLREISGDFLFSCRQMNKEEYVKVLESLEDEKKNMLSYMKQLNERVERESVRVAEQHETILKQRARISRLEAKLKEIDQEKEKAMAKNRRTTRINEYTRSQSNTSVGCVRPMTKAKEKFTAEIDKYKFKLEVALEKIAFLEKKVKEQNEEKQEDNKKFVEIISKSKEIFKNLFDGKENGAGDKVSRAQGPSLNTTVNSTFSQV